MSRKIFPAAWRSAGWALSAILLVGAVGCGSDNPSAPGGTIIDPQGTGSGTLLVDATVSGTDDGGGLFSTDFTVVLSDTLAAPVSGATVQISTPGGPVVLIEDAGTPGTYRAATSTYLPGTYVLDVSRGTDFVADVRVAAPDIHTVDSPAPNDTVAANQSLSVSWSRTGVALEVIVESRDYTSPAVEPDDGASVIPASGNPPRDDQRIRVFRANETLVGGGLPGSRFEAKIRNSVEPVIAM